MCCLYTRGRNVTACRFILHSFDTLHHERITEQHGHCFQTTQVNNLDNHCEKYKMWTWRAVQQIDTKIKTALHFQWTEIIMEQLLSLLMHCKNILLMARNQMYSQNFQSCIAMITVHSSYSIYYWAVISYKNTNYFRIIWTVFIGFEHDEIKTKLDLRTG